MNRKVLIGGVLVLAGFIGFRLYQQWPTDEAGGGFQRPQGGFGRSVSAAVAEYGAVSESVTLVGSLRAEEQADISPRVNGRVDAVYVDIGDRVEAGDILAQIEDDQLDEQLSQSEAALEVNRAVVQQRELELRNQELIFERARGLHESGLTSSEQLEQAQTRYDVARAQLNLARAQLLQAEAGLRELEIRQQRMRIEAPMPGYIGRRFVDPGALVNSNTPIVTVVKLDTLKLNRQALRIPREALVVRGEDQGVYVLKDDKAHFTLIEIGLAEADWIEITAGLEVGDQVATMGANLLRDGDAVSIIGAKPRAESTS
jgi:multidrug efflux pump subunit AcrA (membrane-fusion protein)